MRLSQIGILIGIFALTFGVATLLGYNLPLWQTVIVLIGLSIIVEAIASLTKSK
ncbi:MAG: hypothetical protein QXX51_04035 [Candidatus Bathyarchaeia archaeon]